jgi:hypothetical protein
LHHLHAGDYSRWLRDSIKDDELANQVATAERDAALTASESRQRVMEAIDRRYTGTA